MSCIDIRKLGDGTFAIVGGLHAGADSLSPLALRIVVDAINGHNDAVRAGREPLINVPERLLDRTPKYTPLPPYIRLRRRRRAPLRLAIAGLVVACLAAFAVFSGEQVTPSRPVMTDPSLSPARTLADITGPELE